jgi:hypothetical protein
MTDESLSPGDVDSVVVRPTTASALSGVVGFAPALALAALVTATATMLAMSLANEVADAKSFSSHGFPGLSVLRWTVGTRLVVAGIALLLALLALRRYRHDLPVTRYTFSEDGAEATDEIVGNEPPDWIRFLVGAALLVSLLAIVLNGVALAFAVQPHMSPNFGVPTG